MQQIIDVTKNEVILDENGEAFGLFILRGKEKISGNITFVHKRPRLDTRMTLKFILFDESEVDLEATVRIDNGAAQTDTYLKIEALLLSDKARAHIVPSMEILEDDVKGGHGATIGMLDETQLHYLMSRGIPEGMAREIMIDAFVQSLLDQIEDDDVKEEIINLIS